MGMPFSTDRQNALLDLIRSGENVKAACAKAGVHCQTVYSRRASDPTFKTALTAAQQIGTVEAKRRTARATREILSAIVGEPPAANRITAETQAPGTVSRVAEHEDQRNLRQPEGPQLRMAPLGKIDAHGVLWCDVGMLVAAIEAAKSPRTAT